MRANPALLLQLIAQAAREHRDLATALRASGLTGAASVAAALDRGETLDVAMTGFLEPGLARLLAGPCPDLERLALLAEGEWRLRQRRRDSLHQHLAYPVLSAAVVLLGAGVFVAMWPFATAWTWAVLALPPLLLLALATQLHRLGRWGELMPLAGAWCRHCRLSQQFGRAALVARWRLTEAEAGRLLGFDCAPLAAVLARPDASEHCQHLAEHHARHADGLLEVCARVATVLVLASAGAVVLTLALSELQQYLRFCQG